MKLLNYILAGVIGASIATVVSYRIFKLQAEQAEASPPGAVRARPAPARPSADFAKLTQEKAALDAELTDMRAKLAEHDATLVQAKASLEEMRRPMTADIMSSALRAELKSGEVVVTGGYKLSNGKRLYAFAQPVIQQVDGAEVVKIESRFLSVADDAGQSVGLNSIATNATNTLQHGEVWAADEQTSVLTKLNASPGVDLLTSPTITVRPGSSGTIEMGDLKLKVIPGVSADHSKMDFEVRLEQPQAPVEPLAVPVETAPADAKPDASAGK